MLNKEKRIFMKLDEKINDVEILYYKDGMDNT